MTSHSRNSRYSLAKISPILVSTYIFLFFLIQSPKILDYYRVSDDLRQQIYPLYKHRDQDLFKDDLLTRYFISHTPPAYYYAHYPITQLIDPVIWSKIAQLALLAVVLIFLYRIGKHLQDPFFGWLLVFLFIHSPALSGLTDGGLPRGYAVPALTIFLWATLTTRPLTALAATTISAILYPPILLVLGPVLAIWIFWVRPLPWRQLMPLCLCASVAILTGLYPMLNRGPEIGPIITYTQANTMPEWHQGNRFPFLPIPKLIDKAPTKFASAFTPGPLAWIFVALGLYALFQLFRTKSPLALPITAILAISLITYEISSWLAFRLHIPDRTVMYSLPLVGLILVPLSFASFRAFRWLILIPAFLFWGHGFNTDLNLWANQRHAAKLYEFISTLPKNTLIAGPPMEADNLPLFSQRKVYISNEANQPLYTSFYQKISERLKTFYTAYYATDQATVQNFAKQTGVHYMLIKTEDFTHRFHRDTYYYEPYNTFIKSLIANKNPDDFFFAHPPKSSVLYDNNYYQVIKLSNP